MGSSCMSYKCNWRWNWQQKSKCKVLSSVAICCSSLLHLSLRTAMTKRALGFGEVGHVSKRLKTCNTVWNVLQDAARLSGEVEDARWNNLALETACEAYNDAVNDMKSCVVVSTLAEAVKAVDMYKQKGDEATDAAKQSCATMMTTAEKLAPTLDEDFKQLARAHDLLPLATEELQTLLRDDSVKRFHELATMSVANITAESGEELDSVLRKIDAVLNEKKGTLFLSHDVAYSYLKAVIDDAKEQKAALDRTIVQVSIKGRRTRAVITAAENFLKILNTGRCSVCSENAFVFKCSEQSCQRDMSMVCAECYGKWAMAADGAAQQKRVCSRMCVRPSCTGKYSAKLLSCLKPDALGKLQRVAAACEYAELQSRDIETREESQRADARKSFFQRAVERETPLISNLMNAKCPRCSQAILDFDGCAALMCPNCNCRYCGLCLTHVSADTQQAHAHVLKCPDRRFYHIRRDDIFIHSLLWIGGMALKTNEKLAHYLQDFDSNSVASYLWDTFKLSLTKTEEDELRRGCYPVPEHSLTPPWCKRVPAPAPVVEIE